MRQRNQSKQFSRTTKEETRRCPVRKPEEVREPEESSSGFRRYGLFGVSAYPQKERIEEEKRQSMARWAGAVIVFLTFGIFFLLAAGSRSGGLTVTFDSQGGSKAAVQSVPFGGKVKEPDTAVRPGYILKGWSLFPDGSRLWEFDQDTVTEALTLYAVWEAASG